MKIRQFFPFLLLCLSLLLTGCAHSAKNEVKKAVASELDLLKNVDPEAAQKYISYEDLFPDTTETSELSPEIEEVSSLFFADFDYKIMEVKVDEKDKKATASVRLTTIDSRSLAKDYAAAHLKQDILTNLDTSEDTSATSLEDHYLLLADILKKNDFEKVETNCTIQLCQDDGDWVIQRNQNLENDLVGGLLTYLSDPNILTPSETVDVYMKTLKKMDAQQLNTYLNLDSVLATEDEQEKEIATALVDQVHKCFNYKVKKEEDQGYTAQVTVEITSFDSASISENYETALDKYLATPEAVIDGEEGRLSKAQKLLLKAIEKNKASASTQVPIVLVNDGLTWNVELNNKIGQALFGNLSSSTAKMVNEKDISDESSTNTQDSGESYAEDDYNPEGEDSSDAYEADGESDYDSYNSYDNADYAEEDASYGDSYEENSYDSSYDDYTSYQ